VSSNWKLAAGAAVYPYASAQFYLYEDQGCWAVVHYKTVLDWDDMYTEPPQVGLRRLAWKERSPAL